MLIRKRTIENPSWSPFMHLPVPSAIMEAQYQGVVLCAALQQKSLQKTQSILWVFEVFLESSNEVQLMGSPLNCFRQSVSGRTRTRGGLEILPACKSWPCSSPSHQWRVQLKTLDQVCQGLIIVDSSFWQLQLKKWTSMTPGWAITGLSLVVSNFVAAPRGKSTLTR